MRHDISAAVLTPPPRQKRRANRHVSSAQNTEQVETCIAFMDNGIPPSVVSEGSIVQEPGTEIAAMLQCSAKALQKQMFLMLKGQEDLKG